MKFQLNGIDVRVPRKEIEAMVRQHLLGNGVASGQLPPKIGEVWPGMGGVYSGVVVGADGARDYYLITGPAIDATDWESAKKAAAEIKADGHSDFTLPRRNEQAIQFGNVPQLFEKAWYWSDEQHAGGPVCAWFTYFDDGSQGFSLKGNTCRARAVRRLPI